MFKHSLVALGGTFDHFHEGHKAFLQFAFDQGREVIIGITNQHMIQNKQFSQLIQSLGQRKQNLYQFLKNKNFLDRTKIIILNDVFGPTVKQNKIKALIATKITLKGAKKINLKRSKIGLQKLPIYTCPMIKSHDGRYLSSTKIRQGLVSKNGFVYKHLFRKNVKFTLSQKKYFSYPLGELIGKNVLKKIKKILKEKPIKTALVGDYTVKFFLKNQLPFNYGAFDYKINRKVIKPYFVNKVSFRSINPPGSLTKSTADKIYKLISSKNSKYIHILGEEDLTAIVFIMSLPLKSLVVYGQPQKGCVAVRTDEKIKNKIFTYLSSNH